MIRKPIDMKVDADPITAPRPISSDDLEIGIPALRDHILALQKVRTLRLGGYSGKIHVSINAAPETITSKIENEFANLGARLTLQVRDIGLYGNFRFLLENSKSELFTWLALDDDPCWNLLQALPGIDSQSFDLLYSSVRLVRLDPPETFILEEPLNLRNPFNPNPVAIFGIWKTEWLQHSYPGGDFDWLDTFLLSDVLLRGSPLKGPGFRDIGFEKKPPNKVSGKKHQIRGWLSVSSNLALRSKPKIIAVLGLARGFQSRSFFILVETTHNLRRSIQTKRV